MLNCKFAPNKLNFEREQDLGENHSSVHILLFPDPKQGKIVHLLLRKMFCENIEEIREYFRSILSDIHGKSGRAHFAFQEKKWFSSFRVESMCHSESYSSFSIDFWYRVLNMHTWASTWNSIF